MGGGDGQAPPTSSPLVPLPETRAEKKEGGRTLLRSCVLGRLLTQDGIFFFFFLAGGGDICHLGRRAKTRLQSKSSFYEQGNRVVVRGLA